MPGSKINQILGQLVPLIKNHKKNAAVAAVLVLASFAGLAYIIKLNLDFVKAAQVEPAGHLKQVAAGVEERPDDVNNAGTYLPELKRKIESEPEVRDPFNVAYNLKGVITGGNSGSMAIIEAGNTAYVAGVGEDIEGGWKVKEIKAGAVTLTAGEQVMELKFNGRVKTRQIQVDTPENAQPAGSEEGAGQ